MFEKIRRKNNILIFIIFIILIPFCTAELDITLISYDPITNLAKLEISNTDSTDYSKIKLSINNNPMIIVTDYLVSENSASIPIVIKPGEQELTLTTEEGKIVTKNLTFAKIVQQVKEDVKKSDRLSIFKTDEFKKTVQDTQEDIEKKVAEESEKTEQIEETAKNIDKKIESLPSKGYPIYFYGLVVLGFLILSFVIYIFLKKKNFLRKEKTIESSEKTSSQEVQNQQITEESGKKTMPQTQPEIKREIVEPYSEKTGSQEVQNQQITEESGKKTTSQVQSRLKKDSIKLKSYINQALKKGHTHRQIFEALEKSGWNKKIIIEIFKEIESL